MIYLFCNDKYGFPFLLRAKKFVSEGHAKITVVMSERLCFPEDPLRRLVFEMLLWMKNIRKRIKFQRSTGMPLLLVRDVNAESFTRFINSDDHGIIAGFNQIFKRESITRYKTLVNFHPSLLPLYRGPVPSYWCLVNREAKTGFTLHEVNDRIDDGEVLFQKEIVIDETDDDHSLDQKIADEAAKTFYLYLCSINNGSVLPRIVLDPYVIYKTPLQYGTFPDKFSKLNGCPENRNDVMTSVSGSE